MPENLTRKSLGAAAWTASGTGAKLALKFGVLAVLARLVEPVEFGLMAAALVVIEFFEIIVRVGIGPVVVQRAKLDDLHIRAAFTLSLLLGALLTAIMYGAASFVAGTVFRSPELADVLRLACLVLPLHSVAVVPLALLQRDLRFRTIVQVETTAYALGFAGVGIALAAQGFGVWSLVAAHVAEALLLCVLALLVRRFPLRPTADRSALREVSFFGGGFAVARFANYFAVAGDTWVVGRWLGAVSLGFYKYAFELATLPGNLLGQVLDRVLFPAMAKVQHEPMRLARAYRSGLAIVSCGVLPIAAVMFVLADEIVLTVLGPGWEAVVTPFRILGFVAFLRSGLKLTDSLVRATGAVYRRAWRQALYAAAVVGGAWLGAKGGLAGAALGVAGGVTVGWLFMAHLGLELTGLRWTALVASTARALPLTGIMAGLALLAALGARAVGIPSPLVLIGGGLLATLGGLAAVLAFPRALLGEDALSTVRSVLGAVPRPPRVLKRMLENPVGAPSAGV